MEIIKIVKHIKEHVTYPATKSSLVQAVNNINDVSDNDKKWFVSNLPEGKYPSFKDVVNALGLKGF